MGDRTTGKVTVSIVMDQEERDIVHRTMREQRMSRSAAVRYLIRTAATHTHTEPSSPTKAAEQ